MMMVFILERRNLMFELVIRLKETKEVIHCWQYVEKEEEIEDQIDYYKSILESYFNLKKLTEKYVENK